VKSAVRRPLLATVVLAVAALVATTVTGAASAAGPEKEMTAAVLPAATVVPAGRLQSLVAASASASTSESTASAGRALAANRPPCGPGVEACVSLSARKAWLMDGNGRVVYGPVGVLGGRRGEPTPMGTFAVSNKVRNYHSRQFDAPMPYSVFFYPGVAFHTGSLSTRSAGCLHLGSASAKMFFATLQPGDTVQVVG
jgi:lipoprotein-anchoring transpeptidase ErfK/SrfK